MSREASSSLTERAEALLRSLVGVSRAEVCLRPSGGVDRVRVVAEARHSPTKVVQNIRSALFAGVGLRLQPTQVELVSAADWAEPVVQPAPAPVAAAPVPQVVVPRPAGDVAPAPLPAPAEQPAVATVPRPAFTVPPLSARITQEPERRQARLEEVDLVRTRGRIRCRVVLALEDERCSAVAECAEENAAELQLVGRVTCDAARAGRLVEAQFQGATVAYLGGAVHVVAAVNEWIEGRRIARSGSAHVSDTIEQATARAVLQALALS